MMKPRWVTALLVVGLLLAACGSAGQEPAQELAAGATQEVVLEADILPAPSNTPPAAEPAEATEDGSESAAETPTAPSAEPAPAEPSPTEEPQPTATAAPQFNGEYEGTYYRGLATAPITMIDYSDFLWGNCRAYVLGAEKEIVPNYVDNGQVRLVYWPMLDHGQASVNAHAAADCIGRQDVDAFWAVHDQFYENQGQLFRADRDYFVQTAVNAGLDQAVFEACYDGGEAHARVSELDARRKELGIFSRPSFDINGQLLVGSQPYSVYEDYFAAASQ